MVQVSLVGPKTPSSKLVPQEPESDQNIAVFVRCRPLKPNEKKNVIELIPEQKVVKVNDRGANAMLGEKYSRTFNYDAVFGQEASQLEVYKAVVAPLIEQVVAGYNCTVFAYGQTGTGKTYTMEGERSSEELSWEDDPQCGIIPRALHQLFETLTNCVEYTVRVSFSELYNEELYDLLSAIDDTTKLKVFDDPVRKGSVVINGLEEVTVQTKAEIYEILKKGSAKRQTASTLMNACSSRSHTIFSVTVHIKENNIDGEELLKIGKLNLVDLAGSENIGRSGAIDKRAREAGNINQSLLTLGRVITSLVEKAPHVPYRESKLTRLLKDSLGGRTKTSIIATISPNVLDAEDTLSTLDYAQRAKKITNKPEINQKLSKKTLLREYTAEIERLRRDLIACREKNGFFVNEANYQALVQKAEDQEKFIEEKENEIKALKDELDRLMASFEATSEELSAKTVQLAKTTETLTETAKSLKQTETNLEEKKHLLDIHSTNEKKLLTQAEEILAVAEVATGDLSKLYTKLDCHKSLEEDNFSKLGEFQNSFISKMRHFETLLDCGASSIEDLFTSLQPKIDEKFSALCSDIQNIASQIDIHEAEEAVETMVNEINADKGVSNDIAAFGESVAQQKERLQEFKQVVKETVNHRAERLASFVSKIMDSIKCQRGEIENILLAENDRIQKQIAYRAKAIDSVRNSYEDHINAQNEELRKLRETIAGIDVNHNKRAKLQQQKIQAIQEACQQQCRLLSSLLSEESDTNAQLKTNLDLAMSQVSKAESVVSESKEKLFQNLNGISSGFDTREKLSADAINLLDALNSKNIQANLNDMTKLKEEIEESSDSVDKVTVDTLYAEEVSLIGLEKRNAKVLEALKESAKGKETAIKDLRDVLTKGMFKLQESTTQAKENAASVRSEVVQNVGSIEHQMVTWHRSCKREIAARCSEFDLLQSGRLNRYVPTGTTPQKKDFSYPRELVQTSPDEVILSRFRQAMSELNALQTPLPDDSELETKSIDSCTSTESSRTDSSTRSNVENCSPSFIPTPVLSADAIGKHSRKIREKRAKKIVKQNSVNGIKKPLQSTN